LLIKVWRNIKKHYAQHTVIKTPAHRSIQQFGFQLTIDKTKSAVFQGGLIIIEA